MKNSCPLCKNEGKIITNIPRIFYQCEECNAIYLDKKHFLNEEEEKQRYLLHNNDLEDINYQKFVSPIVNAVLENFDSQKHKGLDFGAGTGPVIAKMLSDNGFDITLYDPFFHQNNDYINQQYDFICSCEVIEHFHQPNLEFEKLYQLLNENGKLFLMTHIFDPNLDFDNWYYKNDPTHVFIYLKETFEYIKNKFQFKNLTIINRLIILEK
jgi:2-polyprenyl-3-methyl-5-hydroxy-6-metoxy-1,4-benzoquinol methylase